MKFVDLLVKIANRYCITPQQALDIAEDVISDYVNYLKEHEPYAKNEISLLENALMSIPTDFDELVKEKK